MTALAALRLNADTCSLEAAKRLLRFHGIVLGQMGSVGPAANKEGPRRVAFEGSGAAAEASLRLNATPTVGQRRSCT
jgi:hypothetical protein